MVKILLKIKSRLLTEVLNLYLNLYLRRSLEQDFRVYTFYDPTFDYDLLLFDQVSLKECKPEDFPHSKKILIDPGLTDQEILFLFIYYRLSGVFTADTKPELLPKCIEAVLKGEIWLSRNLMKVLNEDFNSPTKKNIPALTHKEREIIKLICEGLSNKEVAYRLSLSEQTVKCHLNRIFKKTGLRNRTQLMKIFYNTAIVSTGARGENESLTHLNWQSGTTSTLSRPKKILRVKSKVSM